MSKKFPSHPHLRQIGNQAKDLVKAHRRGDPDAVLRISEHLPRLASADSEAILATNLSLQEAQHIVAREYGFPSWKELTAFIKARVSEQDMGMSEQVWDEVHKAMEQIGLPDDNDLVVRRAIDTEIDTEDEKIKLGDVVDIRLWDTPEEREKGNSFSRNISMSTEPKGQQEEAAPVPENPCWNSSGETRDAMDGILRSFLESLETLLAEIMDVEVETAATGTGHTSYIDFASDGPVCFYRFTLLPSGAQAALRLPFSLACSFLGRHPAAGDLQAVEQERLDRLVQQMLDGMRPCWPEAVAAICADLEYCAGPHHLQIAEYDDRGVVSSFLVRSERASQIATFFYPRTTVEEIAPLLEKIPH